jgi:hypothetical protein
MFNDKISAQTRALKIGAQAVGALCVGALAMGALAIGTLAIGRLVIGRSRIRRLEIDESWWLDSASRSHSLCQARLRLKTIEGRNKKVNALTNPPQLIEPNSKTQVS